MLTHTTQLLDVASVHAATHRPQHSTNQVGGTGADMDTAQEQLDHSVDRIMAEADTNHAGMTQYVLVAAHEVVDSDGDLLTTYEVIVGSHDIPLHSALGLLLYGKAFLTQGIGRDRD